jgi:hypothetical protein
LGTHATNTGIQFCLATKNINGTSFSGVERAYKPQWTSFYLPDEIPLINSDSFPKENYLNIYVIPEFTSPSTIGFGTPPLLFSGDGIVIRSDWFGDSATCLSCNLDNASNGLALVHEAGHYLGLLHTFQGSCKGMSDTTCSFEGDKCCDTPPVFQANRDCNHTVNSCSEQNDKDDMTENYMDYATECWNTFTNDQTLLMYATIQSFRHTLTESSNLKVTGLSDCNYHTPLFSADNHLICDSGYVKLQAHDTGRTKYIWQITNENDSIIFSQDSTIDSLIWYGNVDGYYTVQLRVVSSTDTLESTRINFLRVADCGTPIASNQGHWYFGKHAGLKFTQVGAIPEFSAFGGNTNPNPTIDVAEGTISESDATGSLLFYGGPY